MQIKSSSMNEYPLMDLEQGIPLFYPFVSPDAKNSINSSLDTRWIGQGPKVDYFEKAFKDKLTNNKELIATGSGTDALHLAYILSDVGPGDEVITPVFTCTATNLPILYQGAKPIFADIDPLTLNIDPNDVEHRITSKTKAIVAVDYGGIPADYEKLSLIAKKYNLKLISDAAQSIGLKYQNKFTSDIADFVIFSFQAIKTITTADGGMLVMKDNKFLEKAKRIRWFGIDRTEKQKGTWENDIYELGYKYQMTDIGASLGLTGLNHLSNLKTHRKKILNIYSSEIKNKKIKVIDYPFKDGTDLCPWICTIIVNDDRISLMKMLRNSGVESAQVHYRNDRYSVFGNKQNDLPKMDYIEDKYLVIPLHHKVSEKDALMICNFINSY